MSTGHLDHLRTIHGFRLIAAIASIEINVRGTFQALPDDFSQLANYWIEVGECVLAYG